MTFINMCKLGAQTEAEAKKLNWSRMDYLAAHNIKKLDRQSAIKWFSKQPEDWQKARKQRFTSRLNERRW